MSITNFFFKQLLKSKLKDIPQDQQEKIFSILEKNPEFFTKIAEEVQTKIKSGKDQQLAVIDVLSQHKEELEKIMKN